MASRTRRGGSGPWKRKSGAELDLRSLEESVLGAAAARAAGYEVKKSLNKEKTYRCPYCEGSITPGTPHTVAVPVGRPEDRRHYHSACWMRRANQSRGRR
jgi:hypothetical protein